MTKFKEAATKSIPYIGILLVILVSVPKMLSLSTGTLDFIARCILMIVSLGVFSYFIVQNFHHELQSGRYQLMFWLFVLLGYGPSVYIIEINPYIIPLLLGSALITSMIHVRLGFITNFVMLTVLLIVANIPFHVFIIYLLAGAFVSIVIPYAKNRQQYIYVALSIAVLMMVVTLMTILVLEGDLEDVQFIDTLIAGLNGSLVVIIAIGSEPIWEVLFRITSKARLLELASLNEPLLRRLLHEAPGTYHHSVRVSDMVEKACLAVGCNYQLAKAGALYHDIGKLKRPDYFTENQEGDNIHDHLSPDASATYIISHVADGVKLAKESKLPKEVIAIIEQHHGDNRVEYFYNKALEHSDGFEIDEKPFTYDGPKPQTKEAAIVMVADCVEAASKSLSKEEQDLDHIKLIIQSVIFNVFKSNQLNECPMRFDELTIVANEFLKVYNGMFIARVKYNKKTMGINEKLAIKQITEEKSVVVDSRTLENSGRNLYNEEIGTKDLPTEGLSKSKRFVGAMEKYRANREREEKGHNYDNDR